MSCTKSPITSKRSEFPILKVMRLDVKGSSYWILYHLNRESTIDYLNKFYVWLPYIQNKTWSRSIKLARPATGFFFYGIVGIQNMLTRKEIKKSSKHKIIYVNI